MSTQRRLSRADFRWNGHSWETGAQLECWGGFQSRRGAYGAQDSSIPSNGAVRLVYAPEDSGSAPLLEVELGVLQWPLDHADEMQRALLTALLVHYAKERPKYQRFLGEEFESTMPPVHSAEDFKNLIGLHKVFVHQIEIAGLPYVGFEFGCTWEREHSLGVLMHGTRVVRVGGADTAMTFWMAQEDADKQP